MCLMCAWASTYFVINFIKNNKIAREVAPQSLNSYRHWTFISDSRCKFTKWKEIACNDYNIIELPIGFAYS